MREKMHEIYEKAPPTRHELLRLKEQEANVRAGFEILKNKDDIMVKEFFLEAKGLHLERAHLNSLFKSAYSTLVDAQTDVGVIGTKYLSASVGAVAEPTFGIRKVAGTVLPTLSFSLEKKNAFNRGYSPASTTWSLERAASLFEDTLFQALSVGEKEAAAKRLGAEILKARRRGRALEQEILPEIRDEMHGIRLALDMRSRENFSRTKKIKALLGRQ